MELTDLPMFGLVRRRLAWLNQRQEVIAKNIANADTPEYKSHDLKTFDFRDVVRQHTPSTQRVTLAVTDAKHFAGEGGPGRAPRPFGEAGDRRPYETSPDGNQVVLEEQMIRMNETQATHGLMTQLYRKHHAMFKTVTRGGGG